MADPPQVKMQPKEKAMRFHFRNIAISQKVDKQQHIIHATSQFGPYGFITAQGSIDASLQTQSWKADISALNLTSFSGILRQQIGYQIDQGQLNGQLNYRVDAKGDIGGQLDLNLTKIKIEKINQTGNPITTQLGMPLSSALNLATDDDGNLELSFPIAGQQDNPELKWSLILRQKLSDVLVNQITASIGSALVDNMLPLLASAVPMNPAMAYRVLKKGWRLAENLALEPIPFDPTANIPTEKGKKQLEQIAQRLKKRHQIAFTFCTEAALQTTQNQPMNEASESTALTKAKDRLRYVEKVLIQDFQISPKQVITCEPKIISHQHRPQTLVTLSI